MRAPPPVEYTSTPGLAWRAALALLVAASVAVPLGWGLPYFADAWSGPRPEALFEALGRPPVQAMLALAGAALVACGAWLRQRKSGAASCTLRWDGQDWLLPGDAAGRPERRGGVQLMLDLGPWMLVRFLPHPGMGSASWLPLAAGVDPARWAALRGALWNWRPAGGSARP